MPLTLRNFAVILALIDLNLPRGNPLWSTSNLGTLRFATPHALAPQASSLLLDVTPILHFKHVVRSLPIPWKPQLLSSSVTVSLCRTQALRIWTLTSVLRPIPRWHHRCTPCPSLEKHCPISRTASVMMIPLCTTWTVDTHLTQKQSQEPFNVPWNWWSDVLHLVNELHLMHFDSLHSHPQSRTVDAEHVDRFLCYWRTPRRSDLALVSHDETQILVLHWLGIGTDAVSVHSPDWPFWMSWFLFCTIFLTWQISLTHPSPRHPHQQFCWLVRLSSLRSCRSWYSPRQTCCWSCPPYRWNCPLHAPRWWSRSWQTRRHSLIDRLCSSVVLVVVSILDFVSVFGLITLLNNFYITYRWAAADWLISWSGHPRPSHYWAPVHRGCSCRDPPVWWLIQAGWWVTKAPTLFCCSALGFCCAALIWGCTTLIAHLTCSLATLPILTNAVYSSYDASKLHQIETWLDVTCMAGKLNWSWQKLKIQN